MLYCTTNANDQAARDHPEVDRPRQRYAEHVAARNADQPLRAAGDAQPFLQDVLEHQAERDGDDREIDAAHAHRRIGEHRTHQRGRRDPGEHRGQERHALIHREPGRDIGAEAVERGLSERDKAGMPDQDVEPDRHDHQDHAAHQHADLIIGRAGLAEDDRGTRARER